MDPKMNPNYTYAIDISHWWQIKWNEIPDYIQMVFIKATEGDDFVDPDLARHVEGALGAGKTVALYHFYRTLAGKRKPSPAAQADFFLYHTRPYWGDCVLRANDFEQGEYYASLGQYYNPRTGTEINDLYEFHRRMHNSEWNAFDLLYTDWGTWGDMRMMTAANLWQGPQWIKNEPFLDGLWLAWWPYARPKEAAALANFTVTDFKPNIPRPFGKYWMWQIGADYNMPGVYNTDGKPRPADINIIPLPFEEVQKILGVYTQPPEEPPQEPPEISTTELEALIEKKIAESPDILKIQGDLEQLSEQIAGITDDMIEDLRETNSNQWAKITALTADVSELKTLAHVHGPNDPETPAPPPVVEDGPEWKFVRVDGSQETKLFKVYIVPDGEHAGRVKVGDEYGVKWKIKSGDTVVEYPFPSDWTDFEVVTNWNEIKHVKVTNEFGSRKGFIKKKLNEDYEGYFVNVASGRIW